MSSPIRLFFAALNAEEEKLIPQLAHDNLGIRLKCALNELDWIHYGATRHGRGESTYDEEERLSLLLLGTARLVFLALTSRASFDVPVAMFRRHSELSSTVLELCTALGMIQHGRRVAQHVAMGIGEITLDENRQFTITLPAKIENNAGHEHVILGNFNAASRRQFERLLETKAFKNAQKKVKKKLFDLVYPWGEHFIGYDADPILDDYFFGLAYFQIQQQEGFDTFHYALKFGGVSYQHFVLALTFVVSHHMRHVQFAETLVQKNSSTKLENVLTVTADVAPFLNDLKAAVNHFGRLFEDFEEIGAEEVAIIFKTLACGRHSVDLVSAPGCPLPLIVQCSEQGFIHCITGTRSEPVRFLLEALKHHFPQDYDRNQLSRESSLQRAIKRIFSKAFSDLIFFENVEVNSDSKLLTDIDLVVAERTSGIVLLFQLKHQDIYGFNVHAERIRGERLVRQVGDWLITVDGWLKEIGGDGVRKVLKLDREFPPVEIHRLAIGKHFAHQLKELSATTGLLYANWAQLVFATEIASQEPQRHRLPALLSRLKEIPTHQSSHEFETGGRTKWNVGDLTFTMHQVD